MTAHSQPQPIPEPVRTWVLTESDRADREMASWLTAWRDGYNTCLDQYANHIGDRLTTHRHPTRLEILRYGPRGRAGASDPRPGDYEGQGSAT